MATNRLIAKDAIEVYAASMFDAANEAGGVDNVMEVRNQMEDIMRLTNADTKLSDALSNTEFTDQQRYNLAQAVFADCNPVFREVMAVMAERGDSRMLPRVFHAYDDLLAERLNTCVVDVTTVVPLDDRLRSIIVKKCEADLGKKVVLNESIDKSILGGIIMSAGTKRIDASLIHQLARARSVLKDTSDGGESS